MKLRYKIANGLVVTVMIALTAFAVVLSRADDCPPAPGGAVTGDTMSAVIQRCYGPPETLALERVAPPAPADNVVLYRSYPLDAFAEAIRYSEEGRARGKIFLVMD